MTIIGIDLGTTNSLVTYWTEEGPIMIPNGLGRHLTPSAVSVDSDGEIVVGQIALERQVSHPELSASFFKRYMGTKKLLKLGDQEFLPEELSALVIKALKKDAEHMLGKPVHEAVISVPAYFNDVQRKATKRAGELAGLRVERLVTEPTAAAIAYGLHQRDADTKFLVFDLGGGTFDVSILELFDQVMEVRAVAGDNYLGGEDFTQVLIDLFLSRYELTEDVFEPKEFAKLRKQAEAGKLAFSEKRAARIVHMHKEKELVLEVSLDEYEQATKPLLQRLRAPIERALSDASLKVRDLDAILLVGGATRLPFIRTFVSKLFGQLAYANVNPDEVVGVGAGIQAGLKERHESLKEVILTDVCPYTLGTSVSVTKSNGYHESGHFFPIIERNTAIPVSRIERFYTTSGNQRMIKVDILQGEARLSRDNIFLGEINVPVPIRPAGQESVDVRYTYDINGLLEVEVKVPSTGLVKQMMIERNPGEMSPEEMARRIEQLASLKIHPREQQENKWIIARGERLYEEHIGYERMEIAKLLREFEDALDKQEPKKIAEMKKLLKDVFDAIEAKGE
ncbi:molecular chaperone HscC [Paenibacillus sp. 1011MAR3C5]|uniref:molecular chaperone HscC n=1 Tax=Paenibacillus sp. 1011MAR3C5 TaxID=1675787 RepID=UPI000E6B54E9|nr:molecular chaperone HscC [Paenibacillus sp. 1011MAR3C5]RJE86207.1 molecular chaperone HscC [Paenibacillus sp. 1011MAR3C5]